MTEYVVQRAPAHRVRTALRSRTWFLMVLPLILFLMAVYLWPLGQMMVTAFQGDGIDNFRRFFEQDLYTRTLTRTLRVAVETAIITTCLGYPLGIALARAPGRLAVVLLGVVFLPLWTSAIIRAYAWVALLQPNGILDDGLAMFGFGGLEGRALNTEAAVVVGSASLLLPFAAIPVYAACRVIDPALPRAARSLGATRYGVWRTVTFPLTRHAALTGFLLVFLVTLGFYVTPAVLGGPTNLMMSTLISQQVTLFNLPFAAALSLLLMICALLLAALASRLGRRKWEDAVMRSD